MKKERIKSIVTLVVLIILIIIGAKVIVNYAQKVLIGAEEQDLRTNMLLMQAETKKGLEEVCFKIANLDESKEEDLAQINEIKNQYLKGKILNESPEEVKEAVKNIQDFNFDENCYYLDQNTLNEMGIKKITEEQYGYFIAKYDFSNANVEIISTKGYNEKYTLTQINEDLDNI